MLKSDIILYNGHFGAFSAAYYDRTTKISVPQGVDIYFYENICVKLRPSPQAGRYVLYEIASYDYDRT